MPVDFKPKATSTIHFKPKASLSVIPQPKKGGIDNWASKVPVLSQVQDFGIGVGGAIGRAGLGLGQAALKVGAYAGEKIGADPTLARQAIAGLEKAKQEIYTKPFEKNLETVAGKGGTLVGTLAPYLSGGVPKPISPLSLKTIFPRAVQGAKYAVPDMITAAGQSGGDIKTTLATGLTSGVGGALIPTAKAPVTQKILSNVVPGYVGDVASGMAGLRGENRTGTQAFIPGAGTVIGTAAGTLQALPQIRQAKQQRNFDKTVNKRFSVLEGLQGTNKPLDKKIQAADRAGIDTKRVLAGSDLLVDAVDKEGTVHTKNAVSNLNDMLQPWESRVGDALAQENKRVALTDVQKRMLAVIDESELVGSIKQQAKARVAQELLALADEADEAGTVPLKLVHDLKVQTNRTNAKSFIDPEKNAIGKTVGRGLKEFVEDSTDAIDVKTYNAELRKFYAIRDVLEALDGKKVKGGRLGKYFAQVVGGVAGGQIGGPIGAVVGAELGGAIRGVQMSRSFGGSQGRTLQPTQKMRMAIGDQQLMPKQSDNKKNSSPTADINATANVQTIPETAKPTGSVLPQISVLKRPTTSRTQNQPISPSIPKTTIPQSKPKYNFPSSSVIPKSKKTSFLQEMSNKARDEGQKGMVRNPLASQNPLIQEAKKYKSAEEFVKAQGDILYHGTPAKFETKDFKGGYLTADKNYADIYKSRSASSISYGSEGVKNKASGIPRTLEFVIKKDANLFDYTNPKHRALLKDYFGKSSMSSEPAIGRSGQLDWTEGENLREFFDEKGIKFDGIKLDEAGGIDPISGLEVRRSPSVLITNPKILKTKSQLTDIWNQANKPSYLNDMLNKAKTEGERGSVKLPFSGKTVKAIDALTKKELIDTAAYIRSNTYNKTRQDALDALAKKYEINTESGDKKLVLKQINALLNKTKTPETLPGTYTRKRI